MGNNNPEDSITLEGKYYHPLGIWAIKQPSRSKAVDFSKKHKIPYVFQWRGVGTFVSVRPPIKRSDITMLFSARLRR